DSADYGILTISKPITIDGNGVATIAASASHGITINAGISGQVVIRNLSINVFGLNLLNGIYAQSDTAIENVTITGTADAGVYASFTASTLSLTAKDLTVIGAFYGLYAVGGSVEIRDSLFRRNISYGVHIDAFFAPVTALIERFAISSNGTGLHVDGSSGA